MISNSFPVLLTKFQRPSLPSDFVPKPALLEYVNDNIERPLTLISAGGGFGKSTFVNSWLESIPYKIGWLSLDDEDNDIRTFLTYFISSVQQAFPGFGKTSQSLLLSEQLPPINVFAGELVNDLNNLPDRLFLAFDDFHVITNREIIGLFATILKYPIPNLHLILITRTDPPLPLTKLRAQNKMKDVRSSNLRMTEEETKKFIQFHIKANNINSLVKILNDHLEGWITGLRLAVFHLPFQNEKAEDFEMVLAKTNLPEEYFLKEILNNINAEKLKFLLKTSILQNFNPQLSDHLVTESDDDFNSRIIIDELVKKNLFIINLDNEGRWYRYHHLFQSLLQKELKKRYSGETVVELHKRASQWYESVLRLEDAFFHASQINDYDRISELIEKHMHTTLNENKWYVLEQWLKKIPHSYIDQSPALIIARMWVHQHKNEISAVAGLLEKLENLNGDTAPDTEIELQKQFFLGIILFWSTKTEQSMAMFDNVRKNLSPDKSGARSLAIIYYAIASQMNGTGKEVFTEIEKILYDSRNNVYFQTILNGALVYMKLLEGELFAAERISHQILERGQSENDIFGTVWGWYFLGYIAFQQGKYEISEKYFSHVLGNIYIINMVGSVDSYSGMMLSQLALNKPKDFESTLEHFISFVKERNNPVFRTIAYSARARLALLNNDIETASHLIKLANMDFDSGTMLFHIEVPRITLCRILLAQNNPESTNKAMGMLEELLALAEKTRNTPQLINILTLLAIGYKQKDNTKKAVESLTSALIIAEPGNWIQPFAEAGTEICDLLPRINSNDKTEHFVSVLLNEISKVHNPAKNHPIQDVKAQNAYHFDPLSNRELDVIQLLAKRLTNKEIAGELHISESTVKRHTITIYQKLGVNKRREAVLKAREMDII